MNGIAILALEATKTLTGRANAWIDVYSGDHAPPQRCCECEACEEYFRIIDTAGAALGKRENT